MRKKIVCHLPFCFVRRRLLSFHFRWTRLLPALWRCGRHLILKRAKFSAPCACVDNDSADPVSDCTNNETIIFPCEAWALHPRLQEERRFKDWTRTKESRDSSRYKKRKKSNAKQQKTRKN